MKPTRPLQPSLRPAPLASLLAASLWLGGQSLVSAAALLTPTDLIFGLDLDAESNFPGGEAPGFAIDGNNGSKYLNFGERHSGVIVQPGSSATAQSMVLVTANDATERDPASYLLFGSNYAITTTANGSGLDDQWTLISAGNLSLPTDRGVSSGAINFANSASYSSYWVVFPTVRISGTANSLQIAEIQLYTGTDASGAPIFANGNNAIATGWASDIPTNEEASFLIDGNSNTKYLNFGESNSGFWVVPGAGATTVRSFGITTANDSPERDPSSWVLHGQNAAGQWSLIDSGTLSLPDDRNTEGQWVQVNNNNPYLAYRMTFPTVKDGGLATSMQISEVQFYDVIPEPTSALLGLVGLATLARRRR